MKGFRNWATRLFWLVALAIVAGGVALVYFIDAPLNP